MQLPNAATPEPHALLASLYDWEHDEFHDDVDLYIALARRTGGPMLEPACGSGRVLAPIAALGIRVVGVDASQAMLDRARTRLRAFLPSAELYRQDLREPLPTGEFGLIVLALSSFGFLPEPTSQLAVLRNLHRSLRADGVLALDVVHARALANEPEGVAILQKHGPDAATGALVTKWMVQNIHASDETIELLCIYDVEWSSGHSRRLTEIVRFRYFSRFEIELLLDRAGFAVEGVYGSYELGRFEDQSPRLIVLARRRPSP